MADHIPAASPAELPEHCGDICAVIVTYYPEPTLLQDLLRSITNQVDAILLVDNTPQNSAADIAALSTTSEQRTPHIIRFGENRGIAAAQNTGIAWADAHGFDYVLLLDQDSIPAPDMVRQLIAAAYSLVAGGIALAAVGPCYVNPRSGQSARIDQIGTLWTHRVRCTDEPPMGIVRSDALISSGTLLRLITTRAIGGFDEALFIDGVDHEWCLRARDRGYTCYVVCAAVMNHRLGTAVVRYWFGRWRYAPMHSPLRHYYRLRNTLLMSRHQYVPFAWTISQLVDMLAVLAVALLFHPERRTRLAMVITAVWHGLRGRAGPL